MLLGAVERTVGLVRRFAACFTDGRSPSHVEHALPTLIGQRVFGIALGYEDLLDHDGAAIEALFVELFLDAHAAPPKEITLDLDATDDPLHSDQEGRFF